MFLQKSSLIASQRKPIGMLPVLLCRICSSWRYLAISTPHLWKTFVLELYAFESASKFKLLASDIRSWLGRSGTLPLTIQFLFYMHSTSLVAGALSALFEFSSRWESVLIETSPRVPWPHVNVLPSLRDFHGSVLLPSEFPFTSAPHLKILTIYTLPPNPTSISSIPWNQLMEPYTNSSVTLSMVSELFRGCPRLEKLRINVEDSGGTDDIPHLQSTARVKHDTLWWLWLYITPYCGVAVDFLTLPALKELRLGGIPTISHPYCYSQLLDLFTRSKCKLQKLVLICSKFTPDQLLAYLEHPCCQTLTCLIIEEEDSVAIDNEILSRLTYPGPEDKNEALLCHKLAELSLEFCYRSEVSPSADSLGRMVYSRCFGRGKDEQLKSLNLITRYPISEVDRELLEHAQDRGGLRLSYISGWKSGYDDEDAGGDSSEEATGEEVMNG